MSFESCLRSLLVTNAAVAALISDRVRPVQGAQAGKYPEITYQVVNNFSCESLSGSSGLANTRVQFSIWSLNYADQVNVREAVRQALQGFRGIVTDAFGATCEFQYISYANYVDLPVDLDTQIFHCAMDFEVWHVEAQPAHPEQT